MANNAYTMPKPRKKYKDVRKNIQTNNTNNIKAYQDREGWAEWWLVGSIWVRPPSIEKSETATYNHEYNIKWFKDIK
jgi:hypothetical protein